MSGATELPERSAKEPEALPGGAAVGGVPGRLLLEGRDAGVPVIALLIKTHKRMQDFESRLKLAEAIMRLVPSAYCDLGAIREEAEKTEESFRRIWNPQAPPGVRT